MDADGRTAQATLRQMLEGYRASQVVHVAAKLGLADLLASGPKHYEELARETGSDAGALHRLLRALTSIGVFAPAGAGRFAVTPLAEPLRSSVTGSLRAWAIFCGDLYRSWGYLDHSVATKETAFEHLHGMSGWAYREQHPEAARVFDDAMSAGTALMVEPIVDAAEFSRFATIADIGGGQGALLASILEAFPAAKGLLFDGPAAIRDARTMLAGFATRCRLVEGDFFESVPPGGDAYILSRVLHDWNDADVIRILKNVRRAMTTAGTLLVIERALDRERPSASDTMSDLNMLVRIGGRERTVEEFADLFVASGFELSRAIETHSPYRIIEAMPADATP